MTPREYLNDVVLPNYAALGESVETVRSAINAVLTTDALVAHIFFACREQIASDKPKKYNDDSFRAELASRDEDYSLVRDIAKAQKHVKLQSSSTITNASQVATATPPFGTRPWGLFRWDGGPQVDVRKNNGEYYPVLLAVERAIAFLKEEMIRLDLLEGLPETENSQSAAPSIPPS